MRIRLAPVLVAGLGLLLATGESYAQVTACTEDTPGSNCIGVAASSPDGEFKTGDTLQTTIGYVKGPESKGLGNEAAIAFTLSIPSLILADCNNPTADGLTAATIVPGDVSSKFRVVVENTVCKDDSKPCLCPAEGTSQTRAQYANVVVFGPKDLPAPGSGEVTFPILETGPLLTLALKVDNPKSTPLTLHLYNESDNQATQPKPQFGALASVGNTSAVDDTVNRTTSTSNVKFTDGTVNVKPLDTCIGDCDGDCIVDIGDLQIGLNIFFETAQVQQCPSFDVDNTGTVDIGELQLGLNNFFGGCPVTCVPK